MKFTSHLARAVRGSLLLRICALALALGSSVALARLLGPKHYGIYSWVFAIASLLALPSQVGVPTLLVRETARASASQDWAWMRGIWDWSSKVIGTTSVSIALIASAGAIYCWNSLPAETMYTLAWALLLIPLIALGNARGAALRGLHLIVRGQIPELIIRPSLLICLFVLTWYIHGEVSASLAMLLHAVAACAAFVIGAWILIRSCPKKIKDARPDFSRVKQWRLALVPLGLLGGLQVANAQIGIVLLGVFGSENEVAFYKVAASASALALVGLQTSNIVIGPYVARFHAAGLGSKLQKISSIGVILATAVTLPIFAGAFFAGKDFIALLYGEPYEASWVPLVILCAGQLANAVFGSVGILLNMSGHEGDSARLLAVAVSLNVLLCFLLIPRFGAIGAALATAVTTVAWNFAFWRAALRRTGIDGSVAALCHMKQLRELGAQLRKVRFFR